MDKPIIYQLLPRLWGNDCGHPLCGGSLEDNGTGKLSDIDGPALEWSISNGWAVLISGTPES